MHAEKQILSASLRDDTRKKVLSAKTWIYWFAFSRCLAGHLQSFIALPLCLFQLGVCFADGVLRQLLGVG